jgi:hypothetical protein
MSSQIQKYLSRGHKKIEGWFSRDALEIINEINNIQSSENISGSLGEIGVHHGKFFVLLSLISRQNKICLAIDLFEKQSENIDNSGCGDKNILLNNLKRNRCNLANIKILSKNSLDITPEELLNYSGNKLRLFSIDGGHTAEILENDLKLGESVICPGGIIILDDYFDQQWPGVSEGTLKYLISGDSKLIPLAIFDDKIVFTNDANIKKTYISELSKLSPRYIIKDTRYMGETILIFYSSRNKIKNILRRTRLWQAIKSHPVGGRIRLLMK